MSDWETSDDGALALTIVLDQFPRNIFRGDPHAFSSDDTAVMSRRGRSIAAPMRALIRC